MKYVVSRFNHEYSWLDEYTSNVVMYDRSEIPAPNSIVVPNIGSDIYDKFTWIIDNYDNLPDVVCLIKCNLFKYITKEEFDMIKDNKTFTPLLTQNHQEKEGICYYKDNMYYEINNKWYLNSHPCKDSSIADELMSLLGIKNLDFIPFAPGSNYILTKETILKHSKEFYKKLRSYLEWAIYPGEAQIIERGLYTLWR